MLGVLAPYAEQRTCRLICGVLAILADMKLPYGTLATLQAALERHKFKLTRYTEGTLPHTIALQAIRKIEHEIKVTKKIVDIMKL